MPKKIINPPKRKKQALTQKRLKELLHYNPDTGVFTRLCQSANNKCKVGDIAGYLDKQYGYWFIGINYKKYKRSILAWLYMEGYFPEHDMDHENRICHDDRWCNLRHVSHQCNIRNSENFKNNKTGVKGVCFSKCHDKYSAQIKIKNHKHHLGLYHSFTEAVLARLTAEICVGWGVCENSPAYKYAIKHNLIKGEKSD